MPRFSCHLIFRPGRRASLMRCLLWSFLFFALAWQSHAQSQPAGNQKVDLNVVEPYTSPTNGLGSWIWEQVTLDDQTCRFWKAIEIPEGITVTNARLVMTVDNEFTLYLDGRELGRGAEWRELFIFDLTPLLTPGRHILAVDAYNGSFSAGMLLGLRISFANGKGISYKSDKSWRIVPDGVKQWETKPDAESDWPAATIIAPLGGAPWWTSPTAVNMMPSLQPIKLYFWQTGWFQVLLLSICGMVVLTSLWLVAQLVVHRKENFLLERERARIARDIHDDIGSRMTQLVLHGEVVQNQSPADSEMSRQLTWICEEVRGLLSTMDEILWAVNPRRDTLRDFADYVCNYAQQFLKPTRIQILFAVELEIPAAELNLPLRRSLLMAIKEALNNTVKHSDATELRLQIKSQGSRLIVVVQDNGKGFDIRNTSPEGNGLTNMSQRLKELGGSCQVLSQPGKGCRVEFSIPLKRRPWSQILKQKFSSGPNSHTGNARAKSSVQSHDPTQC